METATQNSPSFAIFPTHTIANGRCTCGKDCQSPGKHPLESLVPHGCKDATTDPEIQARWWSRFPDANLAINTDNLVVVDIDPKHGGLESLRELEGEYGETLPRTVTVNTGGGGFHYYMQRPTGNDIHSRNGWRPGIDIKSKGGYVVAPPSKHIEGVYRWAKGKSPTDIAIAPVPDWLLPLLPQKTERIETPRLNGHTPRNIDNLQRAQAYVAKADAASEGNRNDTAFRLAGNVAGFGLGETEIVSLLTTWNYRNNPPLTEQELLQCVKSALVNGTPRAPKEDRPGMKDLRAAEYRDEPKQEFPKLTFAELREKFPKLNAPLIHGLVRLGEILNIIASTKVGKSWLVYIVLLSIIAGRRLFGRFDTEQGIALLVDNELHASVLANRIPAVAAAMGLLPSDYEDRLHVWPLRGNLQSMHELLDHLEQVPFGTYHVIAFDAKYRFALEGVSENDNAAEARFYNLADRIAAKTGATLIFIHHSTKGTQSDKRVTDIGAGGGAQSRAADCHLVLREHEEPGIVVLEAAMRSFAPVDPLSLRWAFPLWLPADDIDPLKLKGRGTKAEERQAERDREGMDATATALVNGPATISALRSITGFRKERQESLLAKLCAEGRVGRRETTLRGNKCYEYSLKT